ncbi:DUF2515 family protein [Bacillus sp. DJP31]|uniref:DUF2515 family protein n=1 Tax=Bacillus sp. DJP31 TaxID=3409789 RepID=UPI003BB7285F
MKGFANMINFFCKKDRKRIVPIISETELSKLMMMPISEKINFIGKKEVEIINRIRKEVQSLNVNNITRTKAYLEFYMNNKEIHWSFLAHMVSRNGGWNMTDLKGSILRELLPTKKVPLFFEFLEKANATIFHDAYSQLLLYRYSKQSGRNLFYLLPHLSVSAFMKPIWDYFWKAKNSPLLTVALIVNEQHHIQRLIDHPTYKNEVLNTILFKAQERFGFTDVLFPHKRSSDKIDLAGVTVKVFENVNERIAIGKTLYGILFNEILPSATSFAIHTPHTGSRADFWPDIFTKKEPKMKSSIKAPLIFSPTLKQSWFNYEHEFQDQTDWYTTPEIFKHLTDYYIPASYNLTNNYKNDLKSLVLMKELKYMVS